MSRLSPFNSPMLLGFDRLEQLMERLAKASDGYPPYNIEQVGADGLRIVLAVAGFAREDLSITVEGQQLTVRGRQPDDPERVYLHRGIAARQFQRSFLLADGIEVTGATLDHGLLTVDLARPAPESRIRTVEIGSARPAKESAEPIPFAERRNRA